MTTTSKMILECAKKIKQMANRDPEGEIQQQIKKLKDIDFTKFSEENADAKKVADLQKKINGFKKALAGTSDPDVKKILEESKKEVEEELKALKSGELGILKEVSNNLSAMYDKYSNPQIMEKLINDLKDMVEEQEVKDQIEKSEETIVTAPALIKAWGEDPKYASKKKALQVELEEAKSWITAYNLATEVLNGEADADEEENANFSVLTSLVKSSEKNLAVGMFDRSIWRKFFTENVLEEMDDPDFDELVNFLCSRWAVVFKLPSNIFKAVQEFASDEETIERIESADTIKSDLVGREPISAKDNDEYISVILSYIKAYEADDKKELKKLRKSRFIFDEKEILDKHF